MKKLSMLSALLAATSLLFSQASLAACDEIVIGSAISLTGKYATNGVHAKNGYEYAITKIKENGGVKIGDKCYNFRVIYYDDESKGDRGATLAERLISQDKVQFMLGPYSSGMTKAIAREVASRGITVNAVSPGFIDTDMTAGMSEKAREAMLAVIPLRRSGTPLEVAQGVAFLASDEAGYITGHVLSINGGMYM